MWEDKILCDEMKWDKWCRHCDIALGYYWPSDDMSGRGSSLSGLQLVVGNWNYRKQNWIRGEDYDPQGNHQENNFKKYSKRNIKRIKMLHYKYLFNI